MNFKNIVWLAIGATIIYYLVREGDTPQTPSFQALERTIEDLDYPTVDE